MSRTLDDLSRWEALDLLGQATSLLEQNRWGSLMLLLGMDDDLFPSGGVTFEELMDIANVRIATLARIAGVLVENIEND